MKLFPQLRVFYMARRAYGAYTPQIVIFAALGLVGGILEGIGINAVIPLLSFIIEGGVQATDPISGAIRSIFQMIGVDFAPKFLLGFIVLLFMARALIMLLITYIQIRISTNYERETRSNLFAKVLQSSWSHLLKEKLGHLETVIMVDVPASTSLLRKFIALLTLATGLTIYLVVAFNISPIVTLVTLGLGLMVFVLSRPLLNRIRMLGNQRVQMNRETAHHVGEHIAGVKTVKAADVTDAVIERGRMFFANLRSISVKVSILQQVIVLLIPPLGVLYIALIFGISFRTGFISLAALPAVVYLIYRIFLYVQQIQDTLQGISELVPHLQSILAYESSAEKMAEDSKGEAVFSLHTELRFSDVRFSYGESPEVLTDVSFSIPKGSMVGLIGPSGSGKTTCVDLILRLLTPTSGMVTLDGVDVKNIPLSSWREHIGYVSQDFFLLHDTVRNNIRFYDEKITDRDIWEALESAHIVDFVKKNPEGLDAVIGEKGVKLSAGQRQRLVIARALARKPELLILDEATSALDNESEEYIKEVIRNLKGRITIVVIAHRLSTIMDSDTLIALENGRVSEVGSPRELLKDKDSYFYKVNSIVD